MGLVSTMQKRSQDVQTHASRLESMTLKRMIDALKNTDSKVDGIQSTTKETFDLLGKIATSGDERAMTERIDRIESIMGRLELVFQRAIVGGNVYEMIASDPPWLLTPNGGFTSAFCCQRSD